MPATTLIRIVRILCELALLWMFFGRAAKTRAARVLSNGNVEFTPNTVAYLAWPLVIALLVWITGNEFKPLVYGHYSWFNILNATGFGLITIFIVGSFPEKIVVNDECIEQVRWLWKDKHILWKEITEINTGKTDRTITINGVNGTKIVHSNRLADRPRLLLELRRHCGENLPADFPTE